MKILYVSGYDSWTQISVGKKPSHHLFGMHQIIDHYEKREDGSIYGVIKKMLLKDVNMEKLTFIFGNLSKKIFFTI